MTAGASVGDAGRFGLPTIDSAYYDISIGDGWAAGLCE
jgi:hypothetical protein